MTSLKSVLLDPVAFGGLLSIVTKDMNVKPLRYKPVQRHYLQHRTKRDIILKARQMGFSTAVQAEHFRYGMTRRVNALTLLDKDKNTTNFRRRQTVFYDNFPDPIILPDGSAVYKPKRSSDNATEVTYEETGAVLTSGTAGALDVGRSNTYSHFHGSEVAFWKDPEKIIMSALQAGDIRWAVLESTPNGAQGWFYEQAMKALKDPHNTVWTLHFYPWFKSPEYQTALEADEALDYSDVELELMKAHDLTASQIKWRRGKIAELGSLEAFLQEYPEDPVTCFMTSGNNFFILKPETFTGEPNGTPDESHTYVAGIDWGRDNDYTVMSVIDATAGRMVAMYRNNRIDYQIMRADMINLMLKWGVKMVLPELNSAEENISALAREMAKAGAGHITVEPFRMDGFNKMPLLQSLKQAIENGLILIDNDVLSAEFRSVQMKQDKLNRWQAVDETGHTPDTVIATALAVQATSAYKVRPVISIS